MNREESIAKKHLEYLGFTDIVYEPDGNIPPDFLINNEIAVEVRRLNQHFEQKSGKTPLEELEYPLIQSMESMFTKIDDVNCKYSYFVSFHFHRPLSNIQAAVKKVMRALVGFLKSSGKSNAEFKITDNLTIYILKSEKRFDHTFILGGYTDLDKGGFVIPELHNNLKIVILEKEGKLSKHKHKYPTWWLLLIDNINYGVSEEDIAKLKSIEPIVNSFDKIIIISPITPEQGLEL